MNTIAALFFRAEAWALHLDRNSFAGTPAKLLDHALGAAMVNPPRGRGKPRSFYLQLHEGQQARAQLLAASARVLGAPTHSMQPGESVGGWLARGFGRLELQHVAPLLRAAATEPITPEALEARAR